MDKEAADRPPRTCLADDLAALLIGKRADYERIVEGAALEVCEAVQQQIEAWEKQG